MSRRFVLEAKAAVADLCLLRDAWLAPGKYTLEAAAYETGAGRAGVATAEISVGDGARRVDRAQVVIVRGALPADQAPADLETGHPLRFGDVILQPSAGEPLKKQGQRPLVFQLSTTPVQWGPAEATGSLRHIADLPLASLAAGPYELRVTLIDAPETRTITARFVVAE